MLIYRNVSAVEIDSESKGKIKYQCEDDYVFAEQLAVLIYQKEGYFAQWTENFYWWTIMSLLFWDIIFARVRGAVILRSGDSDIELDPNEEDFDRLFETTVLDVNGMPHDFFSDEFYSRRKSIINNRIKELQNTDIIEKLKKSFEANYGKNCRSIEDWDRYSIDNLIHPIKFFDKKVVIEICHSLLKNFRINRSGLPDLIVYNEKGFFFSEVKSKHDTISDIQSTWHSFLSETLGVQVELFLINHTERQISNLKKKGRDDSIEVRISFGSSTSKKRDDAIEFISAQPSYESKGEGKDAVYSATFATSNIESLYKMLDLTSGWKTQKIEIDGEIIKSTELRDSLYCYRQKNQESASKEWCKKSNYEEGKKNPFNCKRIYIHEFESGAWDDYGYIDTDKGEWVFELDKIKERIEEEIHRLRFCPLLDPKKVRSVINKLPDRVNPKTDPKWAFQSQDYTTWIWHDNRWISQYADTEFQSYSMLTGVMKISAKERGETIKSFSLMSEGLKVIESESKKKKSGCFVATCIYGDPNSWQILELKKFRDQFLLQSMIGRFLVRFYYIIGPFLADCVGKSIILRRSFQYLLNIVIKHLRNNPL